MYNKKKIIIGGAVIILTIILSTVYFLLPKIEIKLNGERIVVLSLGEEYLESGATANLKTLFSQKELSVNISGNVDTNKVGKYIVTYLSSDDIFKKEKIRVVNVVDKVSPEISLKSEVIGCKKNNLIEYNVLATDNYDGDITSKITYKVRKNTITFTVYDSSNNKSELTQEIHYIDDEKPTITLVGNEIIYLNKGDSYEEFGVKAYDSCDGDITSKIKIVSDIDLDTPGIYEVTYSVSDDDGNVAKAKRYVHILADEKDNTGYKIENGATIYLTFDDGPGQYTEELLNILDEYNIKATFFVTAQFPKYLYLIGDEYNRGHSVGIHTYTHKWSIYSSVDDYLDDFNKIQSVIYEQTGIYSNIFRFPGGSSNTVSRNYSKGIMSKLAKTMEEKGYVYYDWTFDSGDTSKNNSSVDGIIQNVKSNLKGDGEYVILMHDIKKNTIEALPTIIKYALANGYTFDKITENTIVPHFKIAN